MKRSMEISMERSIERSMERSMERSIEHSIERSRACRAVEEADGHGYVGPAHAARDRPSACFFLFFVFRSLSERADGDRRGRVSARRVFRGTFRSAKGPSALAVGVHRKVAKKKRIPRGLDATLRQSAERKKGPLGPHRRRAPKSC